VNNIIIVPPSPVAIQPVQRQRQLVARYLLLASS
jgi:hypothetical protein